jgi:predicted MFS family arabinose efflux permease
MTAISEQPIVPAKARDLMALAGCTLGQAVGCTTLIGFTIGAFVYPLSHAFGWSRAQIQTAPAILILVTLFNSFGVGWLSDKASARWMVGPAQIAFGLCFFAVGAFTTSDIRVFYALHALLALAGACALPITLNRVISTRFARRRGLAVAVMLTGTGLCGLVLPPYLSALIGKFGWRGAYVGLGLLPIGVGLLSLILMPAGPPARVTSQPNATGGGEGLTLGQALRDWRLWSFGGSLLLGGWVSTALVYSIIPFLRDRGVGALAASTALSAYGVAVIAGRLGVGYLIDRFWAPIVSTAVIIPASIALAYMGLHGVGLVGAVIGSALIGAASGGEADMLSYLPVKYFGARHMGRIYAFLYISFILGIGSAGPTVGLLFDHFHSYMQVLVGAAVAWIVSGVLLLALGRYRFKH